MYFGKEDVYCVMKMLDCIAFHTPWKSWTHHSSLLYGWAMHGLPIMITIYSIMCSFNFDVFCFILMPITFTHILYKHFTGTGAIIRSFQCQWIYLELHHVNQLRTNWYHNYNKTGVGVTKPIFSVPLFSHFFPNDQNSGYLYDIKLIFGRCHRS